MACMFVLDCVCGTEVFEEELKKLISCTLIGFCRSDGDEDVEVGLPGCKTVWVCSLIETFHRSILISIQN